MSHFPHIWLYGNLPSWKLSINASDNFLNRQTFKERQSTLKNTPEAFMCLWQSLSPWPDYLCGDCNDMRMKCRYCPEGPKAWARTLAVKQTRGWIAVFVGCTRTCVCPMLMPTLLPQLTGLQSQRLGGLLNVGMFFTLHVWLGLITNKLFNPFCKH